MGKSEGYRGIEEQMRGIEQWRERGDENKLCERERERQRVREGRERERERGRVGEQEREWRERRVVKTQTERAAGKQEKV